MKNPDPAPRARLDAAIDRLTHELREIKPDIYVPLFANTFPLASVAKRAAQMDSAPKIAVNPYDWNWSKEPSHEPPFRSGRSVQLFFATSAEFNRIHAAGISFFAVPVSVFIPRFVFLGLPSGAQPDDPRFVNIANQIKAALSTEGVRRNACFSIPVEITWVSDIPDQAELLAARVDTVLSGRTTTDPVVRFWQSRTLNDALGLLPNNSADGYKLKAFIWSGPLASVARHDASQPVSGSSRRFSGSLKLRDPELAQICIEIDSLSRAFQNDEIYRCHALFCCIGYKEDSALLKYYLNKQHLMDEPWSLDGHKFKALHGSPATQLVAAIGDFFSALFPAAAELARQEEKGYKCTVEDNSPFLQFVRDYDKFCRTLSPIAQLYTPENYAICLTSHHDRKAFGALFS